MLRGSSVTAHERQEIRALSTRTSGCETGPGMIELFEVENYKSLRHVSVGLRPLTVLIGKNDTGKSSFLEALFHLGQVVGKDADAAFQGPWAIEQLMTRGVDPTTSAIRWRAELAPSARTGLAHRATYSISAGQHPHPKIALRITDEMVEVDGCPDRDRADRERYLLSRERLEAEPRSGCRASSRPLVHAVLQRRSADGASACAIAGIFGQVPLRRSPSSRADCVPG